MGVEAPSLRADADTLTGPFDWAQDKAQYKPGDGAYHRTDGAGGARRLGAVPGGESERVREQTSQFEGIDQGD